MRGNGLLFYIVALIAIAYPILTMWILLDGVETLKQKINAKKEEKINREINQKETDKK